MFRNASKTLFALCIFASFVSAGDGNTVFLSLSRKIQPRSIMPTNVSVITSEQIIESGAPDVAGVLSSETGLIDGTYGTRGAMSNIMLRGSSSEQVLVMIDGRKVNDPAMGLVDLSTIPSENIERIEIIRGGASAIYGAGAFGGVVNIITKKPESEQPALDARISGGSLNEQNYQLDFDVKRELTSALISAGKTVAGGWRDNSGCDKHNFFMRLGFDAKTAGNFDLSGSYFKSELGVPGLGVSLDQYDGSIEKLASSPDAAQDESKQYLRLEHSMAVGRDRLKTSLYASDDRKNYAIPSFFFDTDYKSFTFGTEIQWDTRYGITAGAEWYEEKHSQFDVIMGTTKFDRSRVNGALFLQQELRLGDLSFLPGLRADDNSAFDSVFSPRLTVSWQADERFKISANGAKSWRAPTINELFWPREAFEFFGTNYVTEGNDNLVPEEGITADVGAEYNHPLFKSRVTAFLTNSSNLISWQESSDLASATVTTMPANIGKARQQGMEAEVSHEIISSVSHSLNYTYLWAEDTINHKTLPYRPCNRINYQLTWLLAWKMKAQFNIQHVSSQETGDTYAPIVAQLPDYTLAGIRISQNVAGIDAWLAVQNLLDARYQTRLEYPLPGRTFSAGLAYKFKG